MIVFKYIWKHKLLAILFFILMTASTCIGYFFPYVTSKIINVGIQQNGIESPIPEYIQKDRLNNFSFLNDEELAIINASYSDNATNADFKKINSEGIANNDQLTNCLPTAIAFSDSDEFKSTNQNIMALTNSYKNYIVQNDKGMISQKAINIIRNDYNSGGINVVEIQSRYILFQGLIMLIFVLIGSLIALGINAVKTLILAKIDKETREAIFESVINFSPIEMSKFSESSLITRATSDSSAIANIAAMLLDSVLYTPICIVVGFIFAYITAPMLSWLIVVGGALVLIAAIIMIRWTSPVFARLQYQLDKINLRTRELLSGIYIFKIFNKENFEIYKFDKANKELNKTFTFIGRLNATINPLLSFGFCVLSILIILIGYHFINVGSLQMGDIIAFTSYCSFVVGACTSLGKLLGSLPRASVITKRVEEVVNTKPKISYNNNGKLLLSDKDKEEFSIELRNVNFSYENNVFKLNNINFTINEGETIGIVGTTGSGKTTLINIISRLIDSDSGDISFNKTNIKDIEINSYRNLFAYTPQNSFIFSGTVFDNVAYGNSNENLQNKTIYKYIEDASANDFIENESSLKNEIVQDSNNISGGQKQRLSIARTLASEKEILLFDDCFTSLDYETENKIWENLNSKYKDKTKIIVSSRLVNIIKADKIIVLENGNQVGVGKHEELSSSCEPYQKIVMSQFSNKETAK